MDTSQLRARLHAATEDVHARPAFTAAVLRGARRRRLRYRLTVAVTATVAVGLVGGVTYGAVTTGEVTADQVMAGWLDAPTQGDLADDQRFLATAVKAWEVGKGRSPNASAGVFNDLRDAPHVYWAGTTPAGPAALVMQQAYLHPHEELPAGAADTLQTLVGLVATDQADGQLKLVGDQFQYSPREAKPGSFFFGPEDRVLLVVDPGEPLWEATAALGVEPGEQPDETIRGWRRVLVEDGVALERFDEGGTPNDVLSGPDPAADTAVRLRVAPASRYLVAAQAGGTGPLSAIGTNEIDWPTGTMRIGRGSGPEIDARDVFLDTYVARRDPSGPSTMSGFSAWFVRADLRDGSVAVLGSVAEDGPYRLAVALVAPDLSTRWVSGDIVNRNKVLPVKFRLPDGRGWIVAAHGQQLYYRTDGDWQEAGENAALLPDDATQVLVGDKTVDL